MTKISLFLVFACLSVLSVQAYCRNNTPECRQIQLSNREDELLDKLSLSSTEYSKAKIQEEIEEIRFEAKRLEEKTNHNSTAANH